MGTALVYARGFDFVNYDDYDYVRCNPWVQKALSSDKLRWALTTNAQANRRPPTYLSLLTDASLGAGKPRLPHLTNVLLSCGNEKTGMPPGHSRRGVRLGGPIPRSR